MNKILEKIIGFAALVALVLLMVFFILVGINYKGLGDMCFAFNESIVLLLINQGMAELLSTAAVMFLISGALDKFKSLPFRYVLPGIIYTVGISVGQEIFNQLMEAETQYYMVIFVMILFLLGVICSTVGITFSNVRKTKHGSKE